MITIDDSMTKAELLAVIEEYADEVPGFADISRYATKSTLRKEAKAALEAYLDSASEVTEETVMVTPPVAAVEAEVFVDATPEVVDFEVKPPVQNLRQARTSNPLRRMRR